MGDEKKQVEKSGGNFPGSSGQKATIFCVILRRTPFALAPGGVLLHAGRSNGGLGVTFWTEKKKLIFGK